MKEERFFFQRVSEQSLGAQKIAPPLSLVLSLAFEPPPNNFDDVLLFGRREHVPPWDAMPLLQTTATTGGRGVLRDKNRMMTHGRLLSVIQRGGGR
jgi:hypothetical protein